MTRAKVEINAYINRPLADVFGFVASPENIPKRVAGSIEIEKIPFQLQYIFEPVEVGTLINFVAEAKPGGFSKLADPLMVRAVRKQFETDSGTLKRL